MHGDLALGLAIKPRLRLLPGRGGWRLGGAGVGFGGGGMFFRTDASLSDGDLV